MPTQNEVTVVEDSMRLQTNRAPRGTYRPLVDALAMGRTVRLAGVSPIPQRRVLGRLYLEASLRKVHMRTRRDEDGGRIVWWSG